MPDLIIGVDLDDVMARHAEGWANFHQQYGENLTADDCRDDWSLALPHLTPEELEARKLAFFTNEVVGQFEVIEGSQEGIERLTDFGRVVVLTARRETVRQASEKWVSRHFGRLVEGLYCATYWNAAEEKITKTKALMCQEVGATHLIDDQPKHCSSASSVGVRSLLFGDYPWHVGETLPTAVVKTPTWKEAVSYFDGQS